jgi:lipoate-protein ligase A
VPDTRVWRLFLDPPRDGAVNMAVDEALFEGVQAGGAPVLRLYRWQPPCLSFGRNQPARGAFSKDRAAAAGIEIVRRPTGGLAVFHHRELTYAVALPVGALGSPRQTYLAVNRALVRGLVALGVPAAVAPPARSRAEPLDRTGRNPCFAEAAPGEVSAAGRKLAGSAQRCERRTILQHGSILLDGDQSVVTRLQAGDSRAARSDAITLRELLHRLPAPGELEAALVAGFEQELGVRVGAAALSPAEADRARVLEDRYRSPEWTWRR